MSPHSTKFQIEDAQATISDELLIERMRTGDNLAFEQVMARYWDRIFGRVFELLKNREDAEEVTQDAFIRAHRGLDKFRGDASFSTWLYQIATNLAHNRYWYWFRRKRQASVSIDQPLMADSTLTLEQVLPADEVDPLGATLAQEFIDRVSLCMRDLNEKHREVLVLRNIKNLSYEEIADKLGISVGTVKSRIARARDALKASMGEDFA
jgi:RNA polymerase sigma-70 factor (ECF subfamily)